MTAPFDAAAEKARDKNGKRQARRAAGPAQNDRRTQIEGAIEFDLQGEAAGQRDDDDKRGGRDAAKQSAEQSQWQGMGHDRSGIAERIDGADRPRPAQFMLEEIRVRSVRVQTWVTVAAGIATVSPVRRTSAPST